MYKRLIVTFLILAGALLPLSLIHISANAAAEEKVEAVRKSLGI